MSSFGEAGGGIKTAQRAHSDPSSNSHVISHQTISLSSKDTNDLTLYGSPVPLRTSGRGTIPVRRVSCGAPTKSSIEKDEVSYEDHPRSQSLKTSTISGSQIVLETFPSPAR